MAVLSVADDHEREGDGCLLMFNLCHAFPALYVSGSHTGIRAIDVATLTEAAGKPWRPLADDPLQGHSSTPVRGVERRVPDMSPLSSARFTMTSLLDRPAFGHICNLMGQDRAMSVALPIISFAKHGLAWADAAARAARSRIVRRDDRKAK